MNRRDVLTWFRENYNGSMVWAKDRSHDDWKEFRILYETPSGQHELLIITPVDDDSHPDGLEAEAIPQMDLIHCGANNYR